VKDQLQNFIDAAKKHPQNVKLYLGHNNGWVNLRDNEEPIVWHEAILDHYWDQLENEIDRRKLRGRIVTKIEGIHIENVEMKKERLASLADALSGQVDSNTYLTFVNANLCEEGIISLAKLVDVSSRLHRFRLQYNRINSMKSAYCLSRSLRSHNRITELHLDHCDLGSSMEILLVILQSDVNYIYLSNNNIDSLGSVKITEYLENNPPIHNIDLSRNRLNDDDALLISQALKRNANLTQLNLLGNNITSIGVKALLTCVFDSSSLNAISESNHTLTRINMYYGQRSFSDNSRPIQRLDGFIGMFLLDRTQKVLLALQDKDSLLQYLANVPVELIPEVLAFPRRQVDDQHQRRYLNVLYSTMRWWNMPMLYSYHDRLQQGLM
jgi:hypothetical protein